MRNIEQVLLNEVYDIYYGKMVKNYLDKAKIEKVNTPITLFWPGIGKKYEDGNKLLIVGRAVNGWGDKIIPTLVLDRQINELVTKAKNWEEIKRGEDCPMSWLDYNRAQKDSVYEKEKRYNWQRSAFWRVICDITCQELEIDYNRFGWWNYIAWTNLYKISPYEGGNPPNKMRRLQEDEGRHLFELELRLLSPKSVILITDLSWAERFLSYLNCVYSKYEPSYSIIAKGQYNDSFIYVTTRPERKKHTPFVREILYHLKN